MSNLVDAIARRRTRKYFGPCERAVLVGVRVSSESFVEFFVVVAFSISRETFKHGDIPEEG